MKKEVIYGFREKDVEDLVKGILEYDNIEGAVEYVKHHYIPVVSLEEVEKNYVDISYLFPEQFDKITSHQNADRIRQAIRLHQRQSVSLKWLENYCKENSAYYFGDMSKPKYVLVNDLLSAVKKQASEGK